MFRQTRHIQTYPDIFEYSQIYSSIRLLNPINYLYIATTQFSPELNSLDWGGSIIGKIDHTTITTTTPPPPPPPCDDFFDQFRQVCSYIIIIISAVQSSSVTRGLYIFGLAWFGSV